MPHTTVAVAVVAGAATIALSFVVGNGLWKVLANVGRGLIFVVIALHISPLLLHHVP